MQGVMQRWGFGLAAGLCVSAIAACQSAPDTAEPPTNESTQEQSAASDDVPPPPPTVQPAETLPSSPPTPAAPTTAAQSVEPEPVPPLPAECSDPQTQALMNQCAQAEYEQADVKLNNAYQAVRASLEGQKTDQLVVAEEAWLTYRDAYCDFVQSQFTGGSIQPLVYFGCLEQLTRDRTAELQQNTNSTLSYEAADQELNNVYQSLQDSLNATEQEQLTDAQLAWLDYRDAHCAFESSDTNACLAEVTESQVEQLQQQLESRSR